MLCSYDTKRFYSEENDYCVYVYSAYNSNETPNNNQIFTAVGYGLPNNSKVDIDLTGTWEDSKYGKQLKVTSFKEMIPTTPDGIVGYLSSGLIKGIGKKIATDIVSKFGTDTITVMEYEPERLLEISGITENKLNDIITSFEESRSLQDLVSFLSVFDISHKKAMKIQSHFEGKSLEVIKKSPFRLCEISGFGFITVDKIARSLNCDLSNELRIQEAINYVLSSSGNQGHLYLEEADLADKVHELLNNECDTEVVDRFHIVIEISGMVDKKILFDYKSNIYLYNNFIYESETSKNISNILNLRKPRDIPNIYDIIESSQKRLGIKLGNKQIEAVRMCIINNLSIVTGGPGTGKTTTLKVILDVYRIIFGGKVLQLAPTGRASRKMSESTGCDNAQTIHRALGLMDEDFNINDTELDCDFVVVDETSMMDMRLAYELFKSIGPHTKVLLLGDADQLPSVGAGNVFRELINSGIIPTTKLDQIFRQSSDSLIPTNAHLVNIGNTSLEYGADFQFINCENADDAAKLIEDYYIKNAKNVDINSIQILTPFKSKTKASCNELNKVIQNIMNPGGRYVMEFKSGSNTFRVNDKVMQTKNKNDIFNGDVGIIKSVTANDVSIEFNGNRTVSYDAEDMLNVDLASAMTIHKSQGSEYDVVIIPVLTSFFTMLKRNIIYTAITRAKTKVIFVGQKKALAMAIKKNDIDKRNTNLSLFIRIYNNRILKLQNNSEMEDDMSMTRQIAL